MSATSQAGHGGSTGSGSPTDVLGDETLAAGAEQALVHDELGPGATLGRYVVLDKLGEGGMGVVYAAYDPELGRKVAVKLLRADRGPTDSSRTSGGRLLREAQAMAKVTHPNVVTVHDVGTHGGRVWVAMEFVEGSTLSAWMRNEGPSWTEALRRMALAGRGLAAVHAAGMFHRDFKPDNVMVGADGRVLVMDFGLAGSSEPLVEIAAESGADLPVTETTAFGGGLVGTPAYMAPEQLAGKPADAHADQFAYCVSLWEAMYGVRPFRGSSLVELATAVLDGKLREPPRDRRVPAWLRRAITRGLATDPDRRWPSMEELLAALDRGRASARRRVGAGAIVLLAAVPAAIVGASELEERRVRRHCAAQGESIAASWDATRAEELREALRATGRPDAAGTADRALPWLDDWARTWSEARTTACLDAEVHDAWSAETMDRAVWCLDDRRDEFDNAVRRLVDSADESAVDAVRIASGVTPVAACLDERRLLLAPAPPTADRDEVRAIRAQLAEAARIAREADYDGALALAKEAVGRADALGWAPLRASARLEIGDIHDRRAEYDAAELAMVEAYFDAAESGASTVAARAATSLAWLVGYRLARYDEGRLWVRQGGVELLRAGEEGGRAEAELLNSAGAIAYATASWEDAREALGRVLTIREGMLSEDHPSIANALSNLALVDEAMGKHEEAAESFARVIEIWEKTLGPDHPETATAYNNLAIVHHSTKDYARAEPLFRRALAVREQALGAEHPNTALVRSNLAILLLDSGKMAEARTAFEAALAAHERALGPDHPDLGDSLSGLGEIALLEGRLGEARSYYERALGLLEKDGTSPIELANARIGLARALRDDGGDKERVRALARAVTEAAPTLGEDGREQVEAAAALLAEL